MKRFVIACFTLVMLLSLAGCKSGQQGVGGDNGMVILDFPGHGKVYKADFESIYAKNNGGLEAAKTHTEEQYREYLDLYINFKRKVMEAESLGLHETPEFKSEFEGYRKQLAQPYLVEKDVQEKLVREAYDRMQELVDASHILWRVAPEAPPADTLRAYEAAMDVRNKIIGGEITFDQAASLHSQDPSAKENKGRLGYFTAFDMIYPFETGAYNTEIDGVSMPVRTGYGYHLIKVHDRIANTGRKTASHIIVRVGQQYSAKNAEQAESKIKELYDKLKEGADFAAMANTYSDDPTTAQRGGDLGNGRLIAEMENVKRGLKPGEFSEPFETAFGWHILKVTDQEETKTFEEMEAELRNRIQRDARSNLGREVLIKRVKAESGFQLNRETVDALNKRIVEDGKDKEYMKGFWKPIDSLHTELFAMEVYRMGDGDNVQVGTVKDFSAFYLRNRTGFEGAKVEEATEQFLKAYIEAEVLRFEEQQLPRKYPEYRTLLQEYRDGILLFTLTEDKVWRKAVEDTTGLRNFYDSHQDLFQAGERVVVEEYISEKRETLDEVIRLLSKGHNGREIDSILNSESAINLRMRTQTYEKGKNESADQLFGKNEGQRTVIEPYSTAFRFMVLKEELPAGLKEFDSARSEAITQYQNHLEATWLEELEKKYPVKINSGAVKKLFR